VKTIIPIHHTVARVVFIEKGAIPIGAKPQEIPFGGITPVIS
jgi:hypothetical protein